MAGNISDSGEFCHVKQAMRPRSVGGWRFVPQEPRSCSPETWVVLERPLGLFWLFVGAPRRGLLGCPGTQAGVRPLLVAFQFNDRCTGVLLFLKGVAHLPSEPPGSWWAVMRTPGSSQAY